MAWIPDGGAAWHRGDDISDDVRGEVAGVRRRIAAFSFLGGVLCLVGGLVQAFVPLSVAGVVAVVMVLAGTVLVIVAATQTTTLALTYEGDAGSLPLFSTAVAVGVAMAAVVAVVAVTTFTIVNPIPYTPGMRTWAVDGAGWRLVGSSTGDDATVFPPYAVSPSSGEASSSGTSATSSAPSLVLFTGENLTGGDVTHNNILSDTDDASAFSIVSISLDHGDFDVYGGWIELRNNTGETIVGATVAVTLLSPAGAVLRQITASCDESVVPGGTGRAFFNARTSAGIIAQIQPYTVIWYTQGDGAPLSTWSGAVDSAAKKAAPGTVFHKASPGVGALSVS